MKTATQRERKTVFLKAGLHGAASALRCRRARVVLAAAASATGWLMLQGGPAYGVFQPDTWLPTAGGTYTWGTGSNWSFGYPPEFNYEDNFAVFNAHQLSNPQTIVCYDSTYGTGGNEVDVGGAGEPQTFVAATNPPNNYTEAVSAGSLIVSGTDASGTPAESDFQLPLENQSGSYLVIESYNQESGGPVSTLGSIAFTGNSSLYGVSDVAILGTTVDASVPIHSATSVDVNDGGVLNFRSGASLSTPTISIGSSGILNVIGTGLQLTSATTLTGTGTIGASAGGTLTFASNSSNPGFSGTFSVSGSAAAMAIYNNSALGNGSVSLQNEGTLETKASFSSANSATLSFFDNISVDAGTTFTENGKISGSGALVVDGPGTLILGGGNNYGGGTLIDTGTLSVSADANLGSASGVVALSGGTLATTQSFSTSRSVNLTQTSSVNVAAGTTLTMNGAITDDGSQTLIASGTGTLALGNSNNSFHGLTIEGGTVQFSNAGDISASSATMEFYASAGTLELLGGNTVTTSNPTELVFGASATFNVDSGSTLTLNGTISTILGSNGVADFGSGTLVLAGGNSYLGGTTVGGNVSVSSDANLGDPSGGITFSQTFVGGRFPHFVAGTLFSTASFGSNRSVNIGTQGANIDVAPSTALSLTGNITGSNGIVKEDAGTLILSGNNNYTGGTYISGGTVEVVQTYNSQTGTSNDPLGPDPVTLAGGTLSLQGNVPAASQQVLSIASGFNQDVVVENASGSAASLVSTAFDTPGSKTTGFDFYEHGYNNGTTTGTGGLPNNHTFVSATNPNVSFTLQPYNANNVMQLPANSSGTFVLAKPGRFSSISFLATAADGAASASMDLFFSDGSETIVPENVPDWFTQGAAGALPTSDDGRVAVATSQFDNAGSTYPRLYDFDYNLSALDATKLITSIGFTDGSGGGTLGVFALSGNGAIATAVQSYSNNVTVTADSTINVGSSNEAVMGNLTIGTNTLYITSPAYNPYNSAPAFVFLGATLNGNATFDVAKGIDLQINSPTGSGGITKNNSGLLYIESPSYTGPTTVNAGEMDIDGNLQNAAVTIGSAGTLRFIEYTGLQTLTSLNIASGGTLDIWNNHVLLNYGSGTDPIASIAALLKSGYAGGTWTGTGIDSSIAPGRLGNYGIGYADSADPGNPAGLAADQIEIKYTLLGDANLDGAVNSIDFAILASNFNKAVVGPSGWDQGDFNYDGSINSIDFADLAGNFNKGASDASDLSALEAFASANGLLADVPEPASVALMAGVMGMIAARRRCHSDSEGS